jgi:hypothetical protein
MLIEIAWRFRGRPVPPPHSVKQKIVVAYGRRFGLTTLVETGTHLGNMIAGVRKRFERIYSIELGEDLAAGARARFAGDEGVVILNGDSGVVLPSLLEEIRRPCLFWLDGHFSGGNTALGNSVTPILRELETILLHGVHGHVILVDDVRLFSGEEGYPRLGEVRELVARKYPGAHVEVGDDVMRIGPV